YEVTNKVAKDEPKHAEPLASTSSCFTSTPGRVLLRHTKRLKTPSVSEVSLIDSGSEPHVSGVEMMGTDSSTFEDNGQPLQVSNTNPVLICFRKRELAQRRFNRAGRTVEKKQLSDSFVDPFNLTIDVSEATDGDESDPEYEPSFNITAVLPDEVNDAVEEMAYEEVEFGMELETGEMEESESESENEDIGPGVDKIRNEQDCQRLSETTVCLTFLTQIKTLALTHIEKCKTPECLQKVSIEEEFVGSALYLKWICAGGHVTHRWCSQPIMNRRLHSGDFLAATTILTSGNNYGKLALWAQMMNMKFISASKFHDIQSTYLVPIIDTFWEEHKKQVLSSFQEQELVVLGDGRNDSPGHSAQYCSYTIMEDVSKKILTIHTLDERMAGFQKAMTELIEKGINIKEVVTDAHVGIRSVMKRSYPTIKHSHDIWHVAKNLGKKIMKVAKQKENGVLLQWSKDIINHFWFSCKTASNYEQFLSIWRSVLHHITNKHEWILSHGQGINKCLHEPLSENEERKKPWLDPKKDAKVLKTLAQVLLDQRFLKRVDYYLNFISTAELEVFHQHILMYCAKRFAYTPPVYRIRNELAASDHNIHSDRGIIAVTTKKSGRWTVYPCKEKKTYPHIRDLVQKALICRLEDKQGMRRRRELMEDDPRRIGRNLAPEEPPSTQVLVKEKTSRF
ncbi:hypothetical protein ACJMK2_000497, partial [Sinanodonta woodiana]